MNDLKDFVIACPRRAGWVQPTFPSPEHLLVRGQIWPLKKQDGIISDIMVRAEFHR